MLFNLSSKRGIAISSQVSTYMQHATHANTNIYTHHLVCAVGWLQPTN